MYTVWILTNQCILAWKAAYQYSWRHKIEAPTLSTGKRSNYEFQNIQTELDHFLVKHLENDPL